MTLGVCYYPEHWPRERWADDARAMRAVGIDRVRIGEFAWSLLEPDPGRYDFAWLDEAMDTLHAAGLGVILGTPTATPPKWLIDRHPDIPPVGRDGRRRGFGSRRHYCFRNPHYQRETRRIVTALAERYGRHPGLIAWQTDNEYGCHDTVRCWCPHCQADFRRWLRERYGDVEALNDAWWTRFWSQTYRDFDEVELPEQAVTESNPSHRLDFRRFASDGVVAYNRLQVEILRAHSDRRIVHNSMMLFGDFDHVALAADLDAIAFDNYPLGQLEESRFPDEVKAHYLRVGHPDLVSLSHDLYRGLKNRPHWVMEQQPGPVNWARSNPLPAEGAVRLWTHQGFAHGAETVSWFRWRAATGAQETMHAGLLRHDGSPDQAYQEARTVARERRPNGGTPPPARVALLFDYEDLWAAEIQPHAQGFSYWGALFAYYQALRALDQDVDLVPKRLAGADPSEGGRSLEKYRVLFAPAMQLVDDDLAARLERYVRAGGRLVLGPRSGTKTPSNRAFEAAPGPLRTLAGGRVGRVDGLRPGERRTVRVTDDAEILEPDLILTYATWADLLEADDADVLAYYEDPAYRGAAAYLRRATGDGETRTLGALFEPEAMTHLLGPILREAGLPVHLLPEGVRRSGDTWLNFTDYALRVEGVSLAPYGVTFASAPEPPSAPRARERGPA
ncbi:MAG: beta-galactosidase [Trueperaceae bacterium]|nr:beta-galactosidase [Trueperaceae bacterium]